MGPTSKVRGGRGEGEGREGREEGKGGDIDHNEHFLFQALHLLAHLPPTFARLCLYKLRGGKLRNSNVSPCPCP